MRIRIPEPSSWRVGQKLYAFGEYRVPQDMPVDLADQALQEGAAVLVEDAKPQTAKRKPTAVGVKPVDQA